MEPLRKCLDCGLEAVSISDLSLFQSHKGMKYGKLNVCIACHNLRSAKVYTSEELHENKKQKDRDLREKKLIELGDYEFKLESRRKHLKHKYGITLQDYDNLYAQQEGKCGICGVDVTHTSGYVDHCHITGKIRGILCQKCNTGLGMLGDTLQALQKATQYLVNNS